MKNDTTTKPAARRGDVMTKVFTVCWLIAAAAGVVGAIEAGAQLLSTGQIQIEAGTSALLAISGAGMILNLLAIHYRDRHGPETGSRRGSR